MFGTKKKAVDFPLPTLEWMNEHIVPHCTPDIAELERREFQLMFVYDEMMMAQPYHELIRTASVTMATAFTHEKYTMWKTKRDGTICPVVLEAPKKEFITCPNRPIMGELYGIRPYQFIEIDKHKENGVLFNRKRVNVVIPYREVITSARHGGLISEEQKTMRVNAWMYLGEPMAHPIDGGMYYQPGTRYEPNYKKFWDHDYYYFGPKELDVG